MNTKTDAQKDKERRAQKIAERQNLVKRMGHQDRHFHGIDEDDEDDEDKIESRYGYLLKGQK